MKRDKQYVVEVYSCRRWIPVAWFPGLAQARECAKSRSGQVRKMSRKTL